MLFRKLISVYSENHTNAISTLCGQNVVSIACKLPLWFKKFKAKEDIMEATFP
jgi:hypothetical protein